MTRQPSPCGERPEAGGAAWGTVRTRVATTIRASPDDVAALFLDYARWPNIFPATIRAVELVKRDASSVVVLVHHRREGTVVNQLSVCGPGIVRLREVKPRYEAMFLNRFESSAAGTRYVVDATVRIKQPFTILAPLLRGVVRRALRRYTLTPVRVAAERECTR